MKQLSFILFIPFLLSGQNDFVSLAVSSDTINIGQMVDLDLTIKQSPNASGQLFIDFNKIKNLAYDQDTVALEEYADISISSLSNNEFSLNDNRLAIDVQSIKQYPLKLSMKASIFSIGAFAFSPSYIKPTGDTLISRLGDILFVMPPPGFGQDSTKVINDIKPIIEVESSWKDYLNYMYGFGGLLLLGFLAFLLYRRLKNKGVTIEEVPQPFEVVREAPHLIALRALDLLREEKPWNDGRIKYYQSSLTDIIRTYLEDQFGINALEMTTPEIVNDIQKIPRLKQHTNELRNILTIADLVKFAKATPDESIHQSFLDQAYQFVNQTKPSTHAE